MTSHATATVPLPPLEAAMLGAVRSDAEADATVAVLTQERDRLREVLRLREEVAALRRMTDHGFTNDTKLDTIKEVAAEAFSVTVAQIDGDRRFERMVQARHCVYWIAHRAFTGKDKMASEFLAERTGKKNHCTVLHGCSSVEDKMERDSHFKARVEAVLQVCRKRLGLLEEGQERLL